MKYIVLISLLVCRSIVFAQSLPVLEPTVGIELDFSPAFVQKFNSPQAETEADNVWQKAQSEGRDYSQLTNAELKTMSCWDPTKNSVWDILGGGCSWYCGGAVKSVAASSYLPMQGNISYEPANAHDHNYQTAWVEGVKGYGIGEYIEYGFAPECPRVNTIIIVNGYVKSKASYDNNSRVKTLKMYFNNKPYALLQLQDVYAEQRFSVAPIGNSDRADIEKLKQAPEWAIRFEIVDVYKGLKYDDVVITEIYFDGLDVH